MKRIIFISILLWQAMNIQAQQLVNSGSLIQGGLDDGEKLLHAYVTPINKAIVFGLSDVTYTKIRHEQKRRLLLSIKLAYVGVPKGDFEYNVSRLGLEHIEAKDPNKVIAQTVFGDSLKSIQLVSKDTDLLGRPLFEFSTPKGGGKSALPLPYVGVTYRTKYSNLSLNAIPYVQVPTSDMMVGMLGLSLQQDLGFFIKALRDKPFSLSVQASLSGLYGNSQLDVKPNAVTVPFAVLTGHTTGPYDDQEINIFYTSINVGGYADYTIGKHFTIFAGSSYNMGMSRILVQGTYPIYTKDPSGYGAVVGEDIKDPIDMEDNFSRMKFELGARADWDRFFLQLNYNIADYGGVGLNLGYKMF